MTDYIPGRVSVIVPAYNHAAYVRECIDSALNQTYPDVEVVVVDDGSTDGTYEILQTYGDRIKLIRQENRGTQAARNAAIRASTGEFLALLDSDDMWLPEKLERQMAVFSEHPETALVYAYATEIDEDGKVLVGAWRGGEMPDPHQAFERLLGNCVIPALTAAFRRDVVDRMGYFDEALLGAGDWDMWLKIAERWPVRCVPEPLALYRVHGTNTTKVLFASSQVITEHQRVLERYLAGSDHRAVPEFVANRARARVEVMSAECAALRWAPDDVSGHLAKATSLDPFRGEPASLASLVVTLAQADAARSWPERRCFAEEVFSRLRSASVQPGHAWRDARSELALGQALALYHEGRRKELAEPLLVSLVNRPAYLRNGGVLSMVATLLVGFRAKRTLLQLARGRLCRG